MDRQFALAEMVGLFAGLDETGAIFRSDFDPVLHHGQRLRMEGFNRSTASSARMISTPVPPAVLPGRGPTPDPSQPPSRRSGAMARREGGEGSLWRVRRASVRPFAGAIEDGSKRSRSGSLPHGTWASLSSSGAGRL